MSSGGRREDRLWKQRTGARDQGSVDWGVQVGNDETRPGGAEERGEVGRFWKGLGRTTAFADV